MPRSRSESFRAPDVAACARRFEMRPCPCFPWRCRARGRLCSGPGSRPKGSGLCFSGSSRAAGPSEKAALGCQEPASRTLRTIPSRRLPDQTVTTPMASPRALRSLLPMRRARATRSPASPWMKTEPRQAAFFGETSEGESMIPGCLSLASSRERPHRRGDVRALSELVLRAAPDIGHRGVRRCGPCEPPRAADVLGSASSAVEEA